MDDSIDYIEQQQRLLSKHVSKMGQQLVFCLFVCLVVVFFFFYLFNNSADLFTDKGGLFNEKHFSLVCN